MFFLLRQCSVEVFNGSLQWKCSMEVLMEVFNELNGSSVEELPHSVSCLPQNFPDVSDWAGTSPQPRPPCCVCAVSVWVWWLRFPDRGIFIVHPYVIDTPRARPGPRLWNPVQKLRKKLEKKYDHQLSFIYLWTLRTWVLVKFIFWGHRYTFKRKP